MHINQKVISKMTQTVLLSVFVMMAASCDKPQRAVRATVKTQQNVIAPGPSSQAEQQASAMNVKYSISSIAVPAPSTTGSGYTVNVELQDPSNAYLPFTTRHENGVNLIDGYYNDSGRGLVVHIEARCTGQQCEKYTILVTTFKNNQAVYQTFGISYDKDCAFSVRNSTASFGQMYTNLSVAESQNSNINPTNDIETCPSN